MYSMSGDPEDLSSLVDYEYSKALLTAILKNHSTAQSVEFVNEIDDYVEQNFTKYNNIVPTGQLVVLKDMVDLVIKSSVISIVVSIVVIYFYFSTVISIIMFKHLMISIFVMIVIVYQIKNLYMPLQTSRMEVEDAPGLR